MKRKTILALTATLLGTTILPATDAAADGLFAKMRENRLERIRERADAKGMSFHQAFTEGNPYYQTSSTTDTGSESSNNDDDNDGDDDTTPAPPVSTEDDGASSDNSGLPK